MHEKKVICYLSASAGDWGGASRVLFATIRLLDRSRYEPLLLLPSEGPILPLLQQLGIRYIIWGLAHETNGAIQYVRDIFSAVKLFRNNRVDLLHINHANYWRPAEVLAAKLLRIPVVTHYHVVVQEPGPYVKLSSMIVAVSEYTATHSEPRTVPKVVIHNAVNLERFDEAVDVRAELGLSPDDIVVSFLGQIRTIKGIDLFIKMAHQIRGDAVKFLIVGECRDPKRFEGSYTEDRLRAEIGNDSRIKYVGYRTDVQNVYRSSDIIVMPSRWGEPFGLINIEAGAARKPMVSTRDGGIPEIIRHGENGFLVDREDLDGLIHYTRLLVENEALRRQIGQRAREIVEEQFTELPIRMLEQAYDRLLA
jgi:glycosyltransferase involved in cell wall biosynthesis